MSVVRTRSIKLRGRLAAAAPMMRQNESELRAARGALDPEIDAFCEVWSQWCRTRRYYGPPAQMPSILGQLGRRTVRSTAPGEGRDSFCSAEILAFHTAIVAQPPDALDRRVFEAHYLWHVRNIKTAAHAFGIGRRHWYTLVNRFARRVYAQHFTFMEVWPPQATK